MIFQLRTDIYIYKHEDIWLMSSKSKKQYIIAKHIYILITAKKIDGWHFKSQDKQPVGQIFLVGQNWLPVQNCSSILVACSAVIDALDDDDSIVAYDEGNNQILLRRSDETRHETRVRRLNKILADRIMNFIREIRQWEDTLSIEFKNCVYSDKEWAYKTLETVACDVCHQKVLVASLNTDCIMQTIKGCETIRTAHWLRNFASYEGKQYKMEPKGNLCSRKYKLYSEFCLDQSVEWVTGMYRVYCIIK